MVDFSDEKFLLDEIRKGNNQAFEYLFKAYYPRLRGYAIRFVEDEETARELYARTLAEAEVLGVLHELAYAEVVRHGVEEDVA